MAGKGKRRRTRRGFGTIRHLPSKRYQASYVGPDLGRHNAPHTFETRGDAEGWLHAERRLTESDDWTTPQDRRHRAATGRTLAAYAPGAIARRRVRGEPLRPRTRALYLSILDRVILPDLGTLRLQKVTPEVVAEWYDSLDQSKPTQRAHAYSLLRTVLNQAIEERAYAGENPCRIRGAGRTSRRRRITIATPAELLTITEAMPDRLRLLVVLAAWCGMRYGELAELRRQDVDVARGVVTVSRAVFRVDGVDHVGRPKSDAGIREIAVPPHLLPVVEAHLREHVGRTRDAMLFPRRPGEDRHMIHTELTKIYSKARDAAGRPDLRLHDLRHTGATMAAQSGATMAELMARLGHSTTDAAMRYQHAAAGRDAQIAARLSELADEPHDD